MGGEEEIFLITFWLMKFSKISIRAILIFSFFIFGFPQLVVSISLKVLKISEASFSVRVTNGDRETDVYRTVEQYPIFARAGAIVPMERFEGGNSLGRKTDMELYVFAGADNTFTMYEDEGEYSRFENGVWAKTNIELKWRDAAEIKICAAEGDRSLLPEKRNWTVKLRGFKRPQCVKISANGIESEAEFGYDEEHATVTVAAVASACKQTKQAGGDEISESSSISSSENETSQESSGDTSQKNSSEKTDNKSAAGSNAAADKKDKTDSSGTTDSKTASDDSSSTDNKDQNSGNKEPQPSSGMSVASDTATGFGPLF